MISAGEYLGFLSVDKWTIIFNLINTFILYKIIKKFLFKPVNDIINNRKTEIEKEYGEANAALTEANKLKDDYYEKVENINKEASEIINVAKKRAFEQSNEIIENTKEKVQILLKKADEDIELESKKVINNIKDEMAEAVISATSQIIKKEIDKDKHKEIIDDFFDEVKVI